MFRRSISRPFAAAVAFSLGVAAALGVSFPAAATVITSTLDFDFSGPQQSTGSITATFDDGGGSGSVIMTIDATSLDAGAKISDFWFNFDGDATQLTFGSFSGPTPSGTETCNLGAGCAAAFRPDGDGFFDAVLHWITSGDPNQFDAGDIFSMTISLAGITASDFNLESAAGPGGGGSWCTAAHVQSLGTGGQDSDFLGGECAQPPQEIPEPAALGLLGLALTVLAAASRRRRVLSRS